MNHLNIVCKFILSSRHCTVHARLNIRVRPQSVRLWPQIFLSTAVFLAGNCLLTGALHFSEMNLQTIHILRIESFGAKVRIYRSAWHKDPRDFNLRQHQSYRLCSKT